MEPSAGPVIVGLDATIVAAHSEKEGATPTFKGTFGFHPLLAFVDHGTGGTGESLAGLLRPGRATANDAADHIEVLTAALAQLPGADVAMRSPLRSFMLLNRPAATTALRTMTACVASRWPNSSATGR